MKLAQKRPFAPIEAFELAVEKGESIVQEFELRLLRGEAAVDVRRTRGLLPGGDGDSGQGNQRESGNLQLLETV
jgi:hypothetical protein